MDGHITARILQVRIELDGRVGRRTSTFQRGSKGTSQKRGMTKVHISASNHSVYICMGSVCRISSLFNIMRYYFQRTHHELSFELLAWHRSPSRSTIIKKGEMDPHMTAIEYVYQLEVVEPAHIVGYNINTREDELELLMRFISSSKLLLSSKNEISLILPTEAKSTINRMISNRLGSA